MRLLPAGSAHLEPAQPDGTGSHALPGAGDASSTARPHRQRPVRRDVSEPLARASRRPLELALPAIDLAERNSTTGLSTYVLCRHRFIDDHLCDALDDGVEQVIILGAGYDSRAYRFATQLDGRPVFEVDLPPLSRRKAAIVAAHPEHFGHTAIRRVEIDFRTQSLEQQLDAAGFTVGLPSFVVWEGVAPYLSPEAVDETLVALGELCGAGLGAGDGHVGRGRRLRAAGRGAAPRGAWPSARR